MSKETVAKEIWQMVRSVGGTEEVAAGLLGNAEQESGINPNAGNGDGDWAYGIFQFEFGTSEYTGFISYCNKKGYQPNTSKAQLNYLFVDGHSANVGYAEHLFNVSPRNGHTGHYNFNGGHQYGYSPRIEWKDYLKLTDLEKATKIWELVYEAASLPMMENRIRYAKQWYAKFKGTAYTGLTYSDGEQTSGSSLIANVNKLYTSNNYEYIAKAETVFSKLRKTVAEDLKKSLREKATNNGIGQILIDTVTKIILEKNIIVNKTETSKTMVSGSVKSTQPLPMIQAFVEAPYFEVEMGGVKFGGYHNEKIPNYVRSISVTKTNGNINEYNIQLIHQISPGDDPNYIDKILSAQGYNVISIRYGNANTAQTFFDNSAIITDVSQNFDFANCNIIYNINATSTSVLVSATKRNFPAFEGKVSTKIRKLLWEDKSKELLSIFPGMSDQIEVDKYKLIPDNDMPIRINAVKDVTVLEYLNMLVGRMVNVSNKTNTDKNIVNSVYMMTVQDTKHGNTFKITEIRNNLNSVPFMYEVDIGYPDKNYVLNFNVSNDFAWSVAYESSKSIKKYDYGLDSLGNLNKQNIPAAYKNSDDVIGNRVLWSSLTRFPVTATLTVRGLTQNSLLMQYIKINRILYGAKRITSGVYIVLEQQDNIGNGLYTTTLSLLRVSGDDEYINLDGRMMV